MKATEYEGGGTEKDVYDPDEVESVACPFCGSEEAMRIFREHGVIGIVRCRECSLLYTSPRLRNPAGIYWGDREAYHREARLIFEGKAAHHRDPNYLEEIRWIERHQEGHQGRARRPRRGHTAGARGTLLDVGCNMGMLLRLARERGWDCVGVEPSSSLAGLARDELDLDVMDCFLHEVPSSHDGRYDVIAMSDVYEHVPDPVSLLGHVSRLLAPGGLLYIKVPNGRFKLFKQWAYSRLGRYPDHGVWDAYEDLVHYTDRTLDRMLEKCGFRATAWMIPQPVRVPVWHRYVGHYYQYPSPFALDWKRRIGRAALHWLSKIERTARLGTIGSLSSSMAVIATRKEGGS